MEEYLNELNDQQRAAVCHMDGPSLVIAGAGSGKTRVLTYKIVHLLRHGYEPWRIMALTFTNKAAREMRERIEALVGQQTASRLWMGTFHSVFGRILRANAELIGFKSSFTIYDAADSKSLIKTIIKEFGLDDKTYKPSVVQSTISNAKNALISPEEYELDRALRDQDKADNRPLVHAIYTAYSARCKRAGAMDFDDLLYYTNKLFREHPEVAERYSDMFGYVLVDEYQDTNRAQDLIVQRLCRNRGNLCVVGDDAQSIYSFRGAKIDNILDLEKHYPGLKVFKLERNYRSTQNIVGAANSLIKHNRRQREKNVYSEGAVGDKVELYKTYNDYEEGALVASRIGRIYASTGCSYDDFAVLYRTNAQSRVIEESLRQRNIPYRIYGGLSFYARKEVKDAIAYFRLAVNPDDDEALKRVINYPARGIGDTTVGRIATCAVSNTVSMYTVLGDLGAYDHGVNKVGQRKLEGFVQMIESFRAMNAGGADALELATEIYSHTRMLTELLADRAPENITRQENLQELLNGVRQFVETKREEGSENLGMEAFLAEVSLATDQDEEQGDEPRVTLMTVHAAKGLEFDNVMVVGLEEDLFPSAMAKDTPAQVEEERRLLYVAVTRARRYCMLSYTTYRFRNGKSVNPAQSRFAADFDPEYIRLMNGAKIERASRPVTVRSFRAEPAPASRQAPASRPAPRLNRQDPVSVGSMPNMVRTHELKEIHAGMRIEHQLFGTGTITAIDLSDRDARLQVTLDTGETKMMLLKYARFRILS